MFSVRKSSKAPSNTALVEEPIIKTVKEPPHLDVSLPDLNFDLWPSESKKSNESINSDNTNDKKVERSNTKKSFIVKSKSDDFVKSSGTVKRPMVIKTAFAKVVADYAAKSPIELNLEEEDIVRIVSIDNDTGVATGCAHDVTGSFPIESVRILSKEEIASEGLNEHDPLEKQESFLSALKSTHGLAGQTSTAVLAAEIEDEEQSNGSSTDPAENASNSPPTLNGNRIVTMQVATQRLLWVDYMGGHEAVEKLNLSKKEIKRQEVIYEIITTEQDYLNDLTLICDVYVNPLKKNKLVRPKDHAILFSNIEILQPVNMEILKSFLKRQEENKVIEQVADVFIRMSDYLKMYTMYCSNHPYSLMKLQNLRQNKAIAKFLDQCAQLPESKNLGLGYFLIKPVQRVCKYPLLLRELLRNTEETHPDYENLSKALPKIETVVAIINEGARHTENVHKMIDLQNRFSTRINIIGPSRTMMKSGTIAVKNVYNEIKTREVFLFNDMLIISKMQDGDKLKLINMIPFDAFAMDVPAIKEGTENAEITIHITHVGDAQYFFVFESIDAREVWVEVLQNTLNTWNQHKTRIRDATAKPEAAPVQETEVPQKKPAEHAHLTVVTASTASLASPKPVITAPSPASLLQQQRMKLRSLESIKNSEMLPTSSNQEASRGRSQTEEPKVQLKPIPRQRATTEEPNNQLQPIVDRTSVISVVSTSQPRLSMSPAAASFQKSTQINKPVKEAKITTISRVKPSSTSKSFSYTIDVSHIAGAVNHSIQRTFDEFFDLHMQLIGHFPEEAGISAIESRVLPDLPPQLMFVSEAVAQTRAVLLQSYLDSLVKLPPKISRSPVVLKFLHPR